MKKDKFEKLCKFYENQEVFVYQNGKLNTIIKGYLFYGETQALPNEKHWHIDTGSIGGNHYYYLIQAYLTKDIRKA